MSVKKIVYNTILQSIGKVISSILGLVVIALLSRYLKENGFGEYTTVISFMGFFGILADLGLYLVMTSEISRDGADEKKILGNIFSLRIISVLAMLACGAGIALLFPYSREVKQAMFLGIAAFAFVSGTQVLVGVFQKYLIFYKLIASEIVQRLVMLATTLLFIRLHLGLTAFIWSLVLANGVHFFISLWIARRLIPFTLLFDFAVWRQLLSKSWPLAFSVVLNLMYFKTDTLILSALKPQSDVGLYGLPYKILEVLLAFPAMFAGLIMPFLSRFATTDPTRYRLYLQKSFDAILLIVTLMIVTVMFFARPIIDLVGGQDFAHAAGVLQVLIFATGIIYLGQLLGYTVVALNVQKRMVWGYLTGSIVGLALYFWLIPRYSYYGAAYATIVVELVVCTYAYILTSRAAKFYPSFAVAGKALLAILPAAFLFWHFQWPWILEIALGTVLYLGALIALAAIPQKFIAEIFSRGGENPTTRVI